MCGVCCDHCDATVHYSSPLARRGTPARYPAAQQNPVYRAGVHKHASTSNGPPGGRMRWCVSMRAHAFSGGAARTAHEFILLSLSSSLLPSNGRRRSRHPTAKDDGRATRFLSGSLHVVMARAVVVSHAHLTVQGIEYHYGLSQERQSSVRAPAQGLNFCCRDCDCCCCYYCCCCCCYCC